MIAILVFILQLFIYPNQIMIKDLCDDDIRQLLLLCLDCSTTLSAHRIQLYSISFSAICPGDAMELLRKGSKAILEPWKILQEWCMLISSDKDLDLPRPRTASTEPSCRRC